MAIIKLGTDEVTRGDSLLYALEVYGGVLPKTPSNYLCFHGIMFGYKIPRRVERYLHVFV